MSGTLARLLRVPLVVAFVGGVLAVLAPPAMAQYQPYLALRGLGSGCFPIVRSPFVNTAPPNVCTSVAEFYRRPFLQLMTDAAARSLVLLVGAAILALVVGGLLGVAIALLRRRALASGGLIGLVSVLAAVPSFFVAYFLQITVIVLGAGEGGNILPVFGFGYDAHVVLPLLSISIPAVAYTAQLTATRMNDVLDAEFVTAATAKGLLQSWIVRVHVLPHVRPTVLEGLGNGLRVSVASLPIIETLFNWNGIGALGLQAIALKDVSAFVFCAVVLVSLFAVLGAIADISRPRALFRSV